LTALTRIHRKFIRKNYYGKANYEYVSLWLYIPKKFHELLKPHLSQEFEISMQKRNGKILIALTPKKVEAPRQNISFERKRG
jgi:hypothetical protein